MVPARRPGPGGPPPISLGFRRFGWFSRFSGFSGFSGFVHLAFFRAPPTLREHVRQALQGFAGVLQSGSDLIRIGPRRRIEALAQREKRLLPRGLRRALLNLLARDGIPPGEKGDLLVRRRADDRGRHG